MKKKRVNGTQTSERSFELKSVVVSVLCGVIVMALFLFAFALFYANYDLPLGLLQPLAIITLLMGCLVSGFICSRLINHRGMRWGGICGVLLFLCLLSYFLITQGQPLGNMVFSKCAMMTTSGMIGGIFGVNFGR